MVGEVDTRGSRGYTEVDIPLNRGLFVARGANERPIGSLVDALNVEVVDGALQTLRGPIALGAAVGAPDIPAQDIWVFEGNNAQYTLTGNPVPDGGAPIAVSWYHADGGEYDEPSLFPAGSGYIWYSSTGGYLDSPIHWISHTKGYPPSGFIEFAWSDGSLEITNTSIRFVNIDAPRISSTSAHWPHCYIKTLRTIHSAMGPTYGADSGTWDSFNKPRGHGPISHIAMHDVAVYAVRDFMAGEFSSGSVHLAPGTKIYLDAAGGPVYAQVVHQDRREYNFETGSAQGWLFLEPDPDHPESIEDLLTEWDTTSAAIKRTSDDVDVATSETNTRRHGLLWKYDISDGGVGEHWAQVDPGYSVRFNEGLVYPNVEQGPLFVTDAIPVLQDTGWVQSAGTTAAAGSGSTVAGWSTAAAAASDNGVYATSAFGASDVTTSWLRASLTDTLPADSVVVGVEVSFEAKSTGGSTTKVADVIIADNDGPNRGYYSANMRSAHSEDRGDNQALTTGDVVYTYGGQTDLWGMAEFSDAHAGPSGSSTILIRFADTSAASPTVSVDYIYVRYHYFSKQKKAYIHKDGTDYAEGSIYAIQVHDGDWSSDDAKGWMTLHSVTINEWPIPANSEIRTEAAGAGTLLASMQHMQKNMLPPYDDLRNRAARTESYSGAISGGKSESQVFVVNGTSPAFAIDTEDRFQFIRLPTSEGLDKPRFVMELLNHLVLGLDEHLMVSSVGQANNFNTYDGATSWSLGDQLTGLARMPDNTIVAGCARSLQRLSGSGASGGDPFNLKHISSTRGCLLHSMALADDLYMLSSHGIHALGASDKYGDFEGGSLSSHIEPWLRPRLQSRGTETLTYSGEYSDRRETTDTDIGNIRSGGFLQAVPVRSKNQIWWAFSDGTWLIGALPQIGSEAQQIEFTKANLDPNIASISAAVETYVVYATEPYRVHPSAIRSHVTGGGDEWVLVGTADGNVLRLGVGGPLSYFAASTNPLTLGPTLPAHLQVESTSLIVDHVDGHSLAIIQEPNMRAPVLMNSGMLYQAGKPHVVSSALEDSSVYTGETTTDKVTTYQPTLTDGVSWAIEGTGPVSKNVFPLRLSRLVARVSGRAANKTFGQRPVVLGSDRTPDTY